MVNYLQDKLLTLLKEINDICNEHDIVYYLAGGTALGAVRGGGFLPWDDDIDLYITRDNWNKLVDVMSEITLPSNRDFVCVENADYYWNPIGRYVDLDTTAVMKSQVLCGRACGVLIEFLIMDPMPCGEDAEWRHRELMKIYTELLTPYFIVNSQSIHRNIDFNQKLYNEYYQRSLAEGKDKVLAELLDEFACNPDADAKKYCMRWGLDTLIYDKAFFGKPRLEKFEDGMFPVGEKAEGIFRVAYGDTWMYVPNVDEQVIHNKDSDIDIPFENFKKVYMPLLDRDYYVEQFTKRKSVMLDYMPALQEMRSDIAIANMLLGEEAIKSFDCDYDLLSKSLAERNFEYLEEFFSYYYSTQLSKAARKNLAFMNLDDDFVYYALMTRIANGQYFSVSYIINQLKEREKPLTPNLQHAINLYEFCKKLSIAVFDLKNPTLVDELLSEHLELAHDFIDYDRAMAYVLMQGAIDSNDVNPLRTFLAESLNCFPDDGELLRFAAWAEYQDSNLSRSKELYKKAIMRTRNGFVWKEAYELFKLERN